MKLIGGTMEWKRERSKYFEAAWIIIMVMLSMVEIMMTIIMAMDINIRILLLKISYFLQFYLFMICLLNISYFLQFQLPAASLSVQGHGFER